MPDDLRLICLAAIASLFLAEDAGAQLRESLFPRDDCSPHSRLNPCSRSIPRPSVDATEGPLTDALRHQPLDMDSDPLGLDSPPPPRAGVKLLPVGDLLHQGNRD